MDNTDFFYYFCDMISYKYKLYNTHRLKHLEKVLSEACYMWNHALALQKRYYSIYKKYITLYTMEKHYAKRIKRTYLNSNTMQIVLENLDIAYRRFMNGKAKRPPKFKKRDLYSSFEFKKEGYKILGNEIVIKKIRKKYKFYKSREYEGNIKRVVIKRNRIGEFYLYVITDAISKKNRKTRNGASVGIDFGLKTYLTLSDGTEYMNPLYLKQTMPRLRKLSSSFSKSKKGGSNRERRRKEICRLLKKATNQRDDFQWKLANELCQKYETIFLEDLNLNAMCRIWGSKMNNQAHYAFVQKLKHIATKYDVKIHQIDRFYPSSKTCSCGYVYKELNLRQRWWVCPVCGAKNNRDLLAANNILRRGIYELESDNKSLKQTAKRQSRLHPTITRTNA